LIYFEVRHEACLDVGEKTAADARREVV